MLTTKSFILLLLCILQWFVSCFIVTNPGIHSPFSNGQRKSVRLQLSMNEESDRNNFIPDNMDNIPLSQIFQRAMVLQRSGIDRAGALKAYQEFLKVAELNAVDPMLYAEGEC
jgi:hypothetical protein